MDDMGGWVGGWVYLGFCGVAINKSLDLTAGEEWGEEGGKGGWLEVLGCLEFVVGGVGGDEEVGGGGHGELFGEVGGWVGGFSGFRMRCSGLCGWVGGWVGGRLTW